MFKSIIHLNVRRMLGVLLLCLALFLLFPQATHSSPPAQTGELPFSLPFLDPPGPDTWLLTQTYGNTAGAYRVRATTYAAGQGLHFGIDFAALAATRWSPSAMGWFQKWTQ